jgi:DNA-binding NarL/FixJ family response regulator
VRKAIRVQVISEGRLLVEAIGSLLNRQEGFELVDSAPNLDGQSVLWLTESPDVILVEATVKGAPTTRLVQRLKEEVPQVKVIIFGLEDRPEEVLKFIEAGAIGYLSKDESLADLLKLIEAVYHEEAPCSSVLALSVFGRISELSRERIQSHTTRQIDLTAREKEVLRLLAASLSNKDIAQRLGITPNTVKNHVHNILEKFGVSYRRELVKGAVQCGMIM